MIKLWYNNILQFFKYNCNKHLWRNIKCMFLNQPYDFSFFYLRQKEHLEYMLDYFKKSEYLCDIDKHNIVKYLKLAIYTVNTGYIDGVDIDITKISDKSENNPFGKYYIKCNKIVNRKNIKRFFPNIPESKMNMINDYQLYEQKAKYLYHKILENKSQEWWD